MPTPDTCSSGQTQPNELRVYQTEDTSAMTKQRENDVITNGVTNGFRQAPDDDDKVKQLHKTKMKCRLDLVDTAVIQKEHYITDGGGDEVDKEHEIWQVQSLPRGESTEDTPINCNDIFKPLPGQEKHIRTVMTKGVAGIGKTVSVQKFILDWINGLANQDIEFIFLLPFLELNLVKGEQYCLHRLLLVFHPELKELSDCEKYKDCRVLFIFDGLDENRLPLSFQQSMVLDVNQTSSVDVLITSLIQGDLLPSALIWITSRQTEVSQIPAQYINRVTEIQGFSDPQREEYFRRKISDEDQAKRTISHIKASRSLHIMCHIPVFCWIAATVLPQMLENHNTQEIPQTLTEMLIHFLLVQTTREDQKCGSDQSGNETHKKKCLESQKEFTRMIQSNQTHQDKCATEGDSILKLAELAFKQLEQGNQCLYEEDLIDCGTDVRKCTLYPGIFKESVFNKKKIYSFLHPIIQEFLAALHAFVYYKSLNDHCYALEAFIEKTHLPLDEYLGNAVNTSLDSNNGHQDLLLHFLLGISLETNQRLLQEQSILSHPINSSKSLEKICQHIKELNREDLSPEKYVNLFHCLPEINDHSMDKEVQEYLKSPKAFKGQLTPSQCSALATVLLSSAEVLDEFDLKAYNTSEEGQRRLLSTLKTCRKAQLADCKLRDKLCKAVASVLQFSNLLVGLDLSRNPFSDVGLQSLAAGFHSSNNKLQTIRLADCELSDVACATLALVLQSAKSLRQLDLSSNKINDHGVQHLSTGLSHPKCNLKTLRLAVCELSAKACETLALVLQSANSLIHLDMSSNNIGDFGVQCLSEGLCHPNCNLKILRLSDCKLRTKSCEALATVLKSVNTLTELDLSNNVLTDSGIQHLSEGLSSMESKLQKLSVKDCQISEGGFRFLNSALTANPSHLRELDVRYNKPGETALKLLTAKLRDYHCALKTLYFFAEIRLRPEMQSYACKLTLDPNTANRNLSLSEGNGKVTCVSEVQPYPDHPERFDYWYQVLCRQGLTGRCYWEVEWSGRGATICMSYRSAQRKGKGRGVVMGNNQKSWMVDLATNLAWHNDNYTGIPTAYVPSRKVRVDLDWPAGTLTFYSISSADTLTHLHTFRTVFMEPLYPGFGLLIGSSVSLCDITQVSSYATATPYTDPY